MTKSLYMAAVLVLLTGTAVAQDFNIQVQNHLEASHDTKIEDVNKQSIFEDWLDLSLYGDGYLIGLRYSSFSPPDPVVSDGKSSEGISHRFVEVNLGDTRLRAGTFTTLMGRGLAFRSYENRDLRVDSNLDGLLIEHLADHWQGSLFSGRAETAQMEASEREREDRFSGANVDFNFGPLGAGSSFVQHDPVNTESSRPEMQALRASFSRGPVQLEWEGARLLHGGDVEDGTGNVVEGSVYWGPFNLYGGWKRYKHLSLVAGGAKLMNQPPVLIHDPRATLVQRHPHQLNPNDEEGFLGDLSVNTPLGTFLVSHASTDPSLSDGIGEGSFRESFLEWDHYDVFGLETAHLIVDFQQVPVFDLAGGEFIWDYYFSTAFDAHLDLPKGGLVVGWEHQHLNSDLEGEYDDELVTLEYESEGPWSLSLIGEYVTWTEAQQEIHNSLLGTLDAEYRQFWGGVQLTTQIGEHHDLRIFAGSRREGYICIGGVCRFEPAFDGVELVLISTF